MKQLLGGRTSQFGQNFDSFINPCGFHGFVSVAPFGAGEEAGTFVCPAAGTFRNLIIGVDTAPGTGKSHDYTFRVNGSNTALTCQVHDALVTNRDVTHSVHVNASDRITIIRVANSGPTLPVWTDCSLEFESDVAAESIYGVAGGSISNSASRVRGLFNYDTVWVVTGTAAAFNLVAGTGNVTRYDIRSDTAPGTGKSLAFHIYKNGTKQDGTGGTVDTGFTLSDAATTGSWTGTLPVAPSDYCWLQADPSGTPTVGLISHGVKFVAATDGDFLICGTQTTQITNNTTQYSIPNAGDEGGFNPWTATEADTKTIGGVTTIQIRSLYVRLDAAPGTGKSYAFTIRKNGASAAVTATVADLIPTATDLTHAVAIADGDTWDLQKVPSGTPSTATATWAFVANIGKPVVTTIAASNITSVSAQLNGSVIPEGSSTNGYFIWGTDNPPTQHTTANQALGSGFAVVLIDEVITGLIPGTTYYFMAVGANSVGTVDGAILSFTALSLPSYESPCSIQTPIWWGVLKGHVLEDLSFATYPASQMPQRDAVTRLGGYKPPRLLGFGPIRRTASDWRTGAWQAQGSNIQWADTDRVVRAALDADETGAMTNNEYQHFLDAEEWRAANLSPWLVFQGRIVRDRLVGDLTYEADTRDDIGAGFSLNRIEAEVPVRACTIDFGINGYTNAGTVNITELKVPVIAGTHSDEATTALGRVQVLYMGTMVCLDAVTRHVGLVCGHACDGGVINAHAMKSGVEQVVWGTNAWAPGQTGWATVNPTGAALYTDLTASGNYVNDGLVRRYTLMFFDDSGGKTLGTDFSKGDQAIWASMHGFTANPDGTGGEITQLHAQILHCFQNFFGWSQNNNLFDPPSVWKSGPWLSTPTYEFYPGSGTLVPRIVDQSFSDAAAVSATYTADNSQFQGAFIVAAGGKGESLPAFMARSAISGLFSWGWNTKYSQLFIKMLDRRRTNFTSGASVATDRINVLASQQVRIELKDDLLVSDFIGGWDFNYRTNQFQSINVLNFANGSTASRFGKRPSAPEGYTCVSNTVTATAVGLQRTAFMESVRYMVTWRETLCGLRHDMLGAVVFTHLAGRGSTGYNMRALWIQNQTINLDRTVDFEAYDVDELLS